MRVSFIGMSNIGKSYWARRMAALFAAPHIDCDALIEQKLRPALVENGHYGLRGIAKWMGFPSDPQYKAHSDLYLYHEQEVMDETLLSLQNEPDQAGIIDTTGSVIYMKGATLQTLRSDTCVIYFEASEAHIANLFQRYIANPKPVIWSHTYNPLANEAPEDTLKRCYPILLEERGLRYKELAHLIIPYEQHKDRTFDICTLIKNYVEQS